MLRTCGEQTAAAHSWMHHQVMAKLFPPQTEGGDGEEEQDDTCDVDELLLSLVDAYDAYVRTLCDRVK